MRYITERWHGLSDMKPNGRVLGHVRSLQMFSERMFVSKQTMVGLDAVNAEALVARTPYGLGSFGGMLRPQLNTDRE